MKNILIYNNQTGIADKMKPLLSREGLETVVVADAEQLYYKDYGFGGGGGRLCHIRLQSA